MMLGELLDEWLALRAGQLRPKTVERYRELIGHVQPLHQIEAEQLRPREISRLLAGICDAGHFRTAEQCYVMLKTALSEAVLMGDLDKSPMAAVKRPKYEAQEHEVWTPEEQHRFYLVARDDRRGLELMLGLFCGLRRGEILGLLWEDVDFQAGVLHIRRQLVRLKTGETLETPPKSRAGRRDVPIPEALRRLLAARRQLSGRVSGLTAAGLYDALRRCERAAQVPHIGLHGLRHTMATNVIRSGGSLRVLQGLLGHSSFSLTARVYTHVDGGMRAAALADAATCVI